MLNQISKIGFSLAVLLAFVASPLLAHSAYAVTSSGTGNQYITITPVSRDVSVDPGGSVSSSMTVLNQGSDAFKVDVYATPYRVEGAGYDPQFTRLDGTTDPSKWISFGTSTSTELLPSKVLDVKYTVTVPAATQPGGYYAVIMAETSPSESSASGVTPHNRVGQIIYLTVNGDVKKQGSVSGGSIPSVITGNSVSLPVLVSNTGGIHFKSNASVKVTNMFGNVVMESSQERYILPQTERAIDFTWNVSSVFGIYNIERTATLPDGSVQTVLRTKVLVIKPIVIGSALLIVGFVGFVLIRSRTPRRKKVNFKRGGR